MLFFFCGNAMKITLPNEDIQNQEKRTVRHPDKRKWQYSPIICINNNNETIKTQLDNILYDCCCCCYCKQNSATSNPKYDPKSMTLIHFQNSIRCKHHRKLVFWHHLPSHIYSLSLFLTSAIKNIDAQSSHFTFSKLSGYISMATVWWFK